MQNRQNPCKILIPPFPFPLLQNPLPPPPPPTFGPVTSHCHVTCALRPFLEKENHKNGSSQPSIAAKSRKIVLFSRHFTLFSGGILCRTWASAPQVTGNRSSAFRDGSRLTFSELCPWPFLAKPSQGKRRCKTRIMRRGFISRNDPEAGPNQNTDWHLDGPVFPDPQNAPLKMPYCKNCSHT